MIDYNERTRRRIYLFSALVVGLCAFLVLYRYHWPKTKPSSQINQGLKVLTDPESVVKDLE
jgi:hypothetical protein